MLLLRWCLMRYTDIASKYTFFLIKKLNTKKVLFASKTSINHIKAHADLMMMETFDFFFPCVLLWFWLHVLFWTSPLLQKLLWCFCNPRGLLSHPNAGTIIFHGCLLFEPLLSLQQRTWLGSILLDHKTQWIFRNGKVHNSGTFLLVHRENRLTPMGYKKWDVALKKCWWLS